jgi:hypothetical protein
LSTILKALRRLEKEKAPGDRPLREQVAHAGGDGPALRRWPILLGGIGAGVVAGLAVLFLLLYRGGAPEEAPAAPAAAPAEAAAAAAPAARPPAPPVRKGRLRPIPPAQPPVVARAPAPAAVPPVTSEVEGADEVAVIDRGVPPPRVAVESDAAPDAEAPLPGSVRPFQRSSRQALPGRHLLPEGEAGPTGAPDVPTPSLAPAPAVAPGRSPAAAVTPREGTPPPAVVPAPALARRAPAPAEPEAEVEPAPAKPVTARAAAPPAPSFPAIRVERTTWHPLAERRVAVVEVPGGATATVREGEQVAGTVVRRIEPSGVVFEQAGREVRRKVGAP